MNLGILTVGPREHVVAVAELDDTAAAELGPMLRDTARVVENVEHFCERARELFREIADSSVEDRS
jgi:diadenosine tetraphosphate (Ap4A) HIT family hydrolase